MPISESLRNKIKLIFDDNNIELKTVPNTSTILVSRVIEYVRMTGDTDLPHEIAVSLLEQDGDEHVIEFLCCLILLIGNNISRYDLHDYISILIRASIKLSILVIGESAEFERRSQLLGLMTLVFGIQSNILKLNVLNLLSNELKEVDINVSPALRIALIALTTDSDEQALVQDSFRELCEEESKNSPSLTRNYHSIKILKGTALDSWKILTEVFGRSKTHSQQSI